MELVTVIGVLAFAVGFAALVVGLLTHAELSALRERERPTANEKKNVTEAPKLTHEQRVQQAVLGKEYSNFFNYDGEEQDPIDSDTILADSGE